MNIFSFSEAFLLPKKTSSNFLKLKQKTGYKFSKLIQQIYASNLI